MARESVIAFEESLAIPPDASTFGGFERWAASAAFPETGRIDFLAGDVEVEMSPEDLETHAVVKTAVAARLSNLIVDGDRGEVYIDRTRVVSRKAGLSVEPDVVVALWESFETGRVRYAPSADGRGVELRFSIQTLRDGQYVAVEPDGEGWLRSPRLGGSFRLLRHPARLGHVRYVLEHRP